MEDIWGPMQQGFRDILSGAEVRERRALRRDEAEARQAEMKAKEAEALRKQAEETAKAKARQNLSDYVGSGRSPMIQDPMLAQSLVDAGESIGPAMKPKVDADTLSKFKLRMIEEYMDGTSQVGDPNVDPAGIAARQDVTRRFLGLPTVSEEAMRAAKEKTREINAKIPDADKREVLRSTMKDFLENTVKPFYKNQGFSDEELEGLFPDGKVDDYMLTFANKTNNPLEAIMQTEATTLQGLDDAVRERSLTINRFGTMSSEELEKQDPDSMDDFTKDIWMKSRYLRKQADEVERMTGKPVGNLFESVGASVLVGTAADRLNAKQPSQELRGKLRQRMEEKTGKRKPTASESGGGGEVKKGSFVSPPEDVIRQTGPGTFRGQRVTDLTKIPIEDSGEEDRIKKMRTGIFAR